MIKDKEFLQYIKESGFHDLLDVEERDIPKIKNTYHYQFWRLGRAYYNFAKAMRETKIGSMVISLIEFLDKCFEKIF